MFICHSPATNRRHGNNVIFAISYLLFHGSMFGNAKTFNSKFMHHKFILTDQSFFSWERGSEQRVAFESYCQHLLKSRLLHTQGTKSSDEKNDVHYHAVRMNI